MGGVNSTPNNTSRSDMWKVFLIGPMILNIGLFLACYIHNYLKSRRERASIHNRHGRHRSFTRNHRNCSLALARISEPGTHAQWRVHQHFSISAPTNARRTTDRRSSNAGRRSHNTTHGSGGVDPVARPSQAYASRRSGAKEMVRLLDALPRIHASRKNKENCIICLDPLRDRVMTMGACCHPMHFSCLTSWLKTSNNSSCPVCRSNVLANVRT